MFWSEEIQDQVVHENRKTEILTYKFQFFDNIPRILIVGFIISILHDFL